MSGTIPSMESTNHELKDNTVIVGAYSELHSPMQSNMPR